MLVAEVCRPSPSATSTDVAKLAADYVAWGIDAIAVATDLEDTPGGLQDLFAVCRAVKVPVLQWDWFLHPLQVSTLFDLVQTMQSCCRYCIAAYNAYITAGKPCMVHRSCPQKPYSSL